MKEQGRRRKNEREYEGRGKSETGGRVTQEEIETWEANDGR